MILAIAAGSCSEGPSGGDATVEPTFRPPRVDASRFETRTPIKHVVFLIKENRSFDHLFGLFPGVDGATVAREDGEERPMDHGLEFDQRLPHDLPHDYRAAVRSVNGGLMDGFSVTGPARLYAYVQLQPEQSPNYWHWAEEFVLGDNFFASVNGPSFPNHLMTIAATSGGTHGNPAPPGARRPWRVQDVGVRCARDREGRGPRGRRAHPGPRRRGRRGAGGAVLRLPHGG